MKGKSKGKSRYFADQYFTRGVRNSLDISEVKREFPERREANQTTSTATAFYRMDAGDELFNANKKYYNQATSSHEEGKETKQEKVLSFAMFLEGTRQCSTYHTVKGEKRRGLLIDPGAASGLIGSETLRDLMEHCIPEQQRQDHVIWNNKTTSVAGISGESDQTLGEISLRLSTANRPISYRGDVLGGAGSLCPALVGNPTLRQQQAALFSDWFPNGDGLLSIHRAEMLGPDQQPILLRLLLTDSGHYLLPTDGVSNNQVSEETRTQVSFLTSSLINQSKKQWPNELPQIKHCFLSQNQAETDRSEKKDLDSTNNAVGESIAEGNHSGTQVGRGTCPCDRCYPVKPTPVCEPMADEPMSHCESEVDEDQRADQDIISDRFLTQPIEKKEDVWLVEGQWLIREHNVPRRTMFTPACSKTCPVELSEVTKVRKTEIVYLTSKKTRSEEEHFMQDDWTDGTKAHCDLGRPWKGRTCFLIHDRLHEYWQSKNELDSWLPRYHEDLFPFDDPDKVKDLHREYRAMPEEFYTKTGRRPVTPENVEKWLDEVVAKHPQPSWHFVELYSGSGRLSTAMAAAGLEVGFPVDLRYGWNINNPSHQKKLMKVFHIMKPAVIFASPRCKFHSTTSNTMSAEKKARGRLEDEPGLEFIKRLFQQQSYDGRGFLAEQPWGSTLWTESPLKPEDIPGCRKKQRCDQCMVGACDEQQQPIQKATGFIANMKLRKTCKRCGGHQGKPHAHLQGKINGMNRTSLAAVYPKTMCHQICKDVIQYLTESKQIKIPTWPRSLQHIWHSHLYKCLRCQLGRAAPAGVEHSLLPGECRHGVYPTADGKRPRVVPPDPTADWKKKVRVNPLEDVKLEVPEAFKVTPEDMVYWKSALLQLVNDSINVLDEATKAGKECSHWVSDQVLMNVVRGLVSDVMNLKGIKICLRPWHFATPEPQLSLHSTPLRIQIRGTVKHWIMDPMEDLSACSASQIKRKIDIDDWQVTLFGNEVQTKTKKKKQETKTKVDKSPMVATEPSRPSSSASSSTKKRSPPADEEPDLSPLREQGEEEDEKEAEAQPLEEDVEVFQPRQISSKRPLYDFKKVFQRLPQLATANPQMAIRLLLGLHEKYWHAPPGDLKNLLARTGMPLEVLNLVGDAVMKCEICRRYVRLPNRPQLKIHNAGTFNQCVQADLFKIWGDWVLVLVDEATRYKIAVTTQTRESQELLQKLLEHWMRYFGPPASLVMDQEGSLMSHETAAEFERLNIERKPRGTTAGAAAAQHTGTGLVERHIGLLRLTMLKLRAELNRQGISYETSEIAMEAAMAHNSTLNYGGVTPAMAVFGILPRGFYDDESAGILSTAGALQSDLTVFEKALRIRQMSLSAVQKAIVEDRTARANRTRSHRIDTASLVPGTSEVEFYRDILGDVGWRGPALLLHLDADEGVAVIQYQGRPYLVSIRHIRPHVQTFATEQSTLKLNDQAEDEMLDIMKMVEAVPPQSKRMLGFLPDHQAAGMVWRKIPGGDGFNESMFKKAKTVSSSLTTRELTGIIYGRSLKFLRPPRHTTGYALTWTAGSTKYGIQEHWSGTALICSKDEEDEC